MILELGDKMSYIITRHAALSRVKCIFMIFWMEAYVTNFLEQKDPTPEPINRSCSTTANVSSSIFRSRATKRTAGKSILEEDYYIRGWLRCTTMNV
jgi:hypothetical protein